MLCLIFCPDLLSGFMSGFAVRFLKWKNQLNSWIADLEIRLAFGPWRVRFSGTVYYKFVKYVAVVLPREPWTPKCDSPMMGVTSVYLLLSFLLPFFSLMFYLIRSCFPLLEPLRVDFELPR